MQTYKKNIKLINYINFVSVNVNPQMIHTRVLMRRNNQSGDPLFFLHLYRPVWVAMPWKEKQWWLAEIGRWKRDSWQFPRLKQFHRDGQFEQRDEIYNWYVRYVDYLHWEDWMVPLGAISTTQYAQLSKQD